GSTDHGMTEEGNVSFRPASRNPALRQLDTRCRIKPGMTEEGNVSFRPPSRNPASRQLDTRCRIKSGMRGKKNTSARSRESPHDLNTSASLADRHAQIGPG